MTPMPPATSASAFSSVPIPTDAPFRETADDRRYWVLQFDYQNCYTCAPCDQEVNLSETVRTRFTSEYL